MKSCDLRKMTNESSRNDKEKRLGKYIVQIKNALVKQAKSGKGNYVFKFPFYIWMFRYDLLSEDYAYLCNTLQREGIDCFTIVNRPFSYQNIGIQFDW